MNTRSSNVIIAQMTPKERPVWTADQKHISNRLLRNTSFFAAGFLCLGVCAWIASSHPQKAKAVMNHLSSGFEYDETLGRLQLVSNMLPESAMVFMDMPVSADFQAPAQAQLTHTWSQQEPWLEYACSGDITACADGEVMTIIKNHAGTYTMRILHDQGYESIYSGLQTVHSDEHAAVAAGQVIGVSADTAAFELRKDGVSVLPAFSEI